MDELFKSLSVILYDHEELSSKILKHPSFISYLESNGLSIDEYNKIFDDILKLADKYGDNSEQVNEFLDSHGFASISGGRVW